MNCEEEKMLQWDTLNGQEEHIYDCGNKIKCIIVTKDDQFVIVNTDNGMIFIFDIANKNLHS